MLVRLLTTMVVLLMYASTSIGGSGEVGLAGLSLSCGDYKLEEKPTVRADKSKRAAAKTMRHKMTGISKIVAVGRRMENI